MLLTLQEEEKKKKKKIITNEFIPIKVLDEFTPLRSTPEIPITKTDEFVPVKEAEVEEFKPTEEKEIVTDFTPVKVIDDFIPVREVEEEPEYREWTGLEKTIAPIRSFEAGALKAGARTAAALDTGSKVLAKIISKVTKIPEDKLRGGVFALLEKDLDYYSERAREMGVEGIIGEVAEGLGGASWDIPAIMTFGRWGLPIHGALFGAVEGGIKGAAEGAVTGAFTHKMLGAIGILPSKARLPAFAGFGFAMTPGGAKERTAGSLTWTVLGLAGGKKKVTVREFMDNYPKIRGKLDGMKAGRILKKLDSTITKEEVKKVGGTIKALDDVYKEMYKEEIRQTLESTETTLKQVLMGKITPEQAAFIEELDIKIGAANKAGKRIGKKRLYNTMELAALEADISLKEVLNNADIISRRLVRSKISLSDMMKENKYLFRYLDRVEDSAIRPMSEEIKTLNNTQELRGGIPLENRPYSLPLPEGQELKIVVQKRPGSMPVYEHEAKVLLEGEWDSKAARMEKALRKKAVAGLFKNAIYIFEEYPELKQLLYDPMKLAENVIAKEYNTTESRVISWKKALKKKAPGEPTYINEKGVAEKIKRLGIYAIAQQKKGVAILNSMGIEPVIELKPTEQRIYNAVRSDLESIYNQINQTRRLVGLDPMPKVENYFTFFRNLETLKEEGYNPIYDPDTQILEKKLNAVPFEFAKARGKGILPADLRFFDIYKLYRSKAMKFIYKSPIIAKGRALLEPFDVELEAAGKKVLPHIETLGLKDSRPWLHSVLDGWLKHQAGATTGATGALGKMATRTLGKLNRNVAMWVLSWNFRSAFIQPTALRLTYMDIGAKWLGKGAASYMEESKRNFCEREANVILSRMFDVHAEEIFGLQTEKYLMGKLGKAKAEFGRIGIKPLQVLDLMAAKITWLGAYEKAVAPKAKGGFQMDKAEAKTFANDVVTKTQASAAPSDVAPIQRTPLGKAASLFQTFVINEWNYLYKNVAGMGEKVATPKMPISKRATQIGRLVFATAVINALYEGALHLNSPYPSPEWEVYEAIKEDWGTRKLMVRMAKEMGEQLPLMGGVIRWSQPYRVSYPAILQLGTDGIARLHNILFSEEPELSTYDIDWLGKVFGIPGGGQVRKYVNRRRKGMSHIEAIMGVKTKPREKKAPSFWD